MEAEDLNLKDVIASEGISLIGRAVFAARVFAWS